MGVISYALGTATGIAAEEALLKYRGRSLLQKGILTAEQAAAAKALENNTAAVKLLHHDAGFKVFDTDIAVDADAKTTTNGWQIRGKRGIEIPISSTHVLVKSGEYTLSKVSLVTPDGEAILIPGAEEQTRGWTKVAQAVYGEEIITVLAMDAYWSGAVTKPVTTPFVTVRANMQTGAVKVVTPAAGALGLGVAALFVAPSTDRLSPYPTITSDGQVYVFYAGGCIYGTTPAVQGVLISEDGTFVKPTIPLNQDVVPGLTVPFLVGVAAYEDLGVDVFVSNGTVMTGTNLADAPPMPQAATYRIYFATQASSIFTGHANSYNSPSFYDYVIGGTTMKIVYAAATPMFNTERQSGYPIPAAENIREHISLLLGGLAAEATVGEAATADELAVEPLFVTYPEQTEQEWTDLLLDQVDDDSWDEITAISENVLNVAVLLAVTNWVSGYTWVVNTEFGYTPVAVPEN